MCILGDFMGRDAAARQVPVHATASDAPRFLTPLVSPHAATRIPVRRSQGDPNLRPPPSMLVDHRRWCR
jgi:hypothetical protein